MTRRGFTMVELVGVIAIIAILAAILFPVFARARARAQGFDCQNNLFQIGLALRLYAADHDGAYPPREDDLSPLMPRYMAVSTPFLCPSDSQVRGIPMGAPADYSLMNRPGSVPPTGAPKGGPPGPGGPPSAPPGGAPVAPSPSPTPPTPPSPPPPAPLPTVAPQFFPGDLPLLKTQPGPPEPPLPVNTIFTSYYYRAGRRHNQLPRAPLASDNTFTRHSNRANVLFSDGSLEALTEAYWRAWGFVPLEEVRTAHGAGGSKLGGSRGGGDE